MVTYDSRVCLGSSGAAAMLNRDARARRQAPPRATLRRGLGCEEGTAPAGGWIRRRRSRATGRRRAGKGRIELSLNEIFFFQISAASCVEHFVFLGRGRRGTDWNRVSTRASAKERAE